MYKYGITINLQQAAEKGKFYKILRSMFSDTVVVKYWDREERTYGSGKLKFKLFIGEDIRILEYVGKENFKKSMIL